MVEVVHQLNVRNYCEQKVPELDSRKLTNILSSLLATDFSYLLDRIQNHDVAELALNQSESKVVGSKIYSLASSTLVEDSELETLMWQLVISMEEGSKFAQLLKLSIDVDMLRPLELEQDKSIALANFNNAVNKEDEFQLRLMYTVNKIYSGETIDTLYPLLNIKRVQEFSNAGLYDKPLRNKFLELFVVFWGTKEYSESLEEFKEYFELRLRLATTVRELVAMYHELELIHIMASYLEVIDKLLPLLGEAFYNMK